MIHWMILDISETHMSSHHVCRSTSIEKLEISPPWMLEHMSLQPDFFLCRELDNSLVAS
jgi:hypothetical protein